MNEDLIYKFAHKVGLPHWYQTKEVVNFKLLQEFANLISEHEREACAQICDVLAVHPEYASDITKLAAQAIRNRK